MQIVSESVIIASDRNAFAVCADLSWAAAGAEKEFGWEEQSMYPFYTMLPVIILLFVIPALNRQRKRRRIATARRKNKKEREKKTMPVEMLKPYIGEKVTIMLFGEVMGFECTVLAVEENWIKVDEKRQTRMINGDAINYISVRKPKEPRW